MVVSLSGAAEVIVIVVVIVGLRRAFSCLFLLEDWLALLRSDWRC